MTSGLLFETGAVAVAAPEPRPEPPRHHLILRMDWETKAGRRARADSSDVAAARELVAELKATYDIETTDQTVALAITLLAGRRGLSTSAARDAVARSQQMRS